MAYNQKTSNSSLTTSYSDVGLSVSFTAVASRYYKYTVWIAAADGDANSANIQVTDASGNNKYRVATDMDGPAQFGFIALTYVSTESAGSVTRKVQGKTGTGSATLQAAADFPMWLMVEDIGPA
jgi:hypothetical protein